MKSPKADAPTDVPLAAAPPAANEVTTTAEAPSAAGKSQWSSKRKEKIRLKGKVAKATHDWYHPQYWTHAADAHGIDLAKSPLSDIALLFVKRFPYYTVAYIAIMWFALYPTDWATITGWQAEYAYIHGPSFTSAWYTPYTASWFHTSDNHIMLNAVQLGAMGSLLEITEGHFFMAVVHIPAAAMSVGFHCWQHPGVRIRGASGTIYALEFTQIALLAMNWRELRCERFVRLIFIFGILGLELYQVFGLPHPPGIIRSDAAHVFGALVGIGVGIVCAKNIKVVWYELYIVHIFTALYICYVISMFATGQSACGLWGCIILPKLILDWYILQRHHRHARQQRKKIVAVTSMVASAAVGETVTNAVGNTVNTAVGAVDKTLTTANEYDDTLQNKGVLGTLFKIWKLIDHF